MPAKSKKALKKLRSLEKDAKKRVASVRKDVKKAADKAGKRSKTWLKRARNVSEDDIRHVIDHGVDEADSLLESAQGWIVKLAKRVRMLYDMLVAWWMGRFEFPRATVAAITLALIYFINPFDVVPDVLPLVGVVDDAMVFAFVTKMMTDDLRRYAKKFGLKPAEVGL